MTRIAATVLALVIAVTTGAASRELPFARFEPTPQEIVDAMLEVAALTPGDRLYDLGSGDGRVVITAAKKYGSSGVGVEINRDLVRRATRNAKEEGVADKVKFIRKDLFDADIRQATVVTLYLLPQVNLALRPKLLRDLQPGVRIISHNHNMGEWLPEKTVEVADNTGRIHRVHVWTVPPQKDQPPLAGG